MSQDHKVFRNILHVIKGPESPTPIDNWTNFCIFPLMKTPRYSVIPKYLTLARNSKIGLFEKHFEESCFSRSVDLGTRLMKSKD